jgi:hypothetical protein
LAGSTAGAAFVGGGLAHVAQGETSPRPPQSAGGDADLTRPLGGFVHDISSASVSSSDRRATSMASLALHYAQGGVLAPGGSARTAGSGGALNAAGLFSMPLGCSLVKPTFTVALQCHTRAQRRCVAAGWGRRGSTGGSTGDSRRLTFCSLIYTGWLQRSSGGQHA